MKRVLVLDVGGTNLKMFLSPGESRGVVPSGPRFTPRALVSAARTWMAGRPFDAVSIGIPAVLVKGEVVAEPPNLGGGWVGFDFRRAFGKPVRLINDAAMQALGSHEGGTMLFMGLGTGLGTALVAEGRVIPLELSLLPYRRGNYEDYLGLAGYRRLGPRKWRAHVAIAAAQLKAAMVADYVVLGGGRALALKELPQGCRLGHNELAREGGLRLWKEGATT